MKSIREVSPDHKGIGFYRTDEGYKTPCWYWTGCLASGGYGQTQWKGRVQNAHRAVYELLTGEEVPDGYCVDHLCRNRRCVNPEHMEVVTMAENTRRGKVAKLTPDQVRAIRETEGEIGCREWGRRLGIAHTVASQIRTGKRWVGV